MAASRKLVNGALRKCLHHGLPTSGHLPGADVLWVGGGERGAGSGPSRQNANRLPLGRSLSARRPRGASGLHQPPRLSSARRLLLPARRGTADEPFHARGLFASRGPSIFHIVF